MSPRSVTAKRPNQRSAATSAERGHPFGISRSSRCGSINETPYRASAGSQTLRRVLTEAGQAAGKSKRTYLGATYQRIAARRRRKKPAIAVGRSILEIAYHVLRDGVAYEESGANHYDERQKESIARKAVQRLKRLGYKVTIEAA